MNVEDIMRRETERGKEKMKNENVKKARQMNEWMKESEKVCVVSPISREREREKREARGSPLGKQRRLHAGIPPLVFFFSFSPFIIVCAVYTACSCTIGLFLEISPKLLLINTLGKISDQNYTTSPDVTSKFRFLFFSF